MRKSYYFFLLILSLCILSPTVLTNASILTNTIEVDPNETITNTISSFTVSDYYTTTLSTNGELSFTIKNDEKQSWKVTVKDLQENELLSFRSSTGTTIKQYDTFAIGLAKGTYQIEVDGSVYSNKVPYSLSLNFKEGNLFEKESNNTLLNANSLALNNTITGIINKSNDTDFYKISVTQDGQMQFTLPNTTKGIWYAKLTDEAGYSFEFNTSKQITSTATTTRKIGLRKGTYYLQITGSSLVNIPYQLSTTFKASNKFEQEPDGTILSAGKTVLNSTYTGEIQSSSDVDFYEVKVNESGKLSLTMTAKPGPKWYVTITDAAGQVYEKFSTPNDATVNKNVTAYLGVPKGTYYVKIEHAYQAIAVPYQLGVHFLPSKMALKKR